jgi:hypothetical protein
MATMISSYPPYMYHQQSYNYHQQAYNYPILPSVYSQPPIQNNYYVPQQQQQQQQTKTVEYVNSEAPLLRPRREPRVYRQVIVLPTPEPIYRQVRHRLPTPDRQVIQRTVIQKANGDVIVQQQRPTKKPRSQSRLESKTQSRPSRSRQVHTD